jgi:hypothetical protein
MSELDSMFLVAGVRLIRTGMVVQLATVKQERNAAILKVIKKEGALRRLSEQLQKVQAELEQVRASREQYAAALSHAHDALRKSEAISEKAIGDVTKLGRTLSSVMAALGVPFGPWTPETLIEEVGLLPGMVWELELSGSPRGAPDPHHDRVALLGAGPHDAEWRLDPRNPRRPVRQARTGLCRLRSRDG